MRSRSQASACAHWAYPGTAGVVSRLSSEDWAVHHRAAIAVAATCQALELATALVSHVPAASAAAIAQAASAAAHLASVMSAALESACRCVIVAAWVT